MFENVNKMICLVVAEKYAVIVRVTTCLEISGDNKWVIW